MRTAKQNPWDSNSIIPRKAFGELTNKDIAAGHEGLGHRKVPPAIPPPIENKPIERIIATYVHNPYLPVLLRDTVLPEVAEDAEETPETPPPQGLQAHYPQSPQGSPEEEHVPTHTERSKTQQPLHGTPLQKVLYHMGRPHVVPVSHSPPDPEGHNHPTPPDRSPTTTATSSPYGMTPQDTTPYAPPREEEEDDTDFLVVVVQFHAHRCRFRCPRTLRCDVGMYIVTEADRGIDVGKIVHIFGPLRSGHPPLSWPLPHVLRFATEDQIQYHRKEQVEITEHAHYVAQLMANQLDLALEVERCEFQYDLRKLTVYFRSDGTVHFSPLAKALFHQFGARVWLQQINRQGPLTPFQLYQMKKNGGRAHCPKGETLEADGCSDF